MGIGAGIVELYRLLEKQGFFANVNNVLEIGSQELQCAGHSRCYASLLKQAGQEVPPLESLESFLKGNPPARELYKVLGVEYSSIDTNRMHDSIFLDLNIDPLPEKYHGKFDMVTNYGTLEHTFNQLNGFRVCHDATKRGGYIFHLFPFLGYLDHGFFSYHPNLIYALAEANDYSVEGMWVNLHPAQHEILVPFSPDLVKRLRLDFDTAISLIVLLKKNSDQNFEIPFQPVYSSDLMGVSNTRYHFIVDGTRVVGSDYLLRQIPVSVIENNIGMVRGRSLVVELARRIMRRVTFWN